jgi:diaminopimelate decarboxylase
MQDYSLNSSIKSGDLVTFGCAGAYGAVMSSSYNSRDIIPEVLVSGKKTRLIRRRLDQKELVSVEEGEALLTTSS